MKIVPGFDCERVQPGFEKECRWQAALVAKADRDDPELMAFLDAAFEDWAKSLDDWERSAFQRCSPTSLLDAPSCPGPLAPGGFP